MRIQINESELPERADDDAPPWERDVPEGWRETQIRDTVTDKFHRGNTHELMVTFVDAATGAWIDQRYDTSDARGLRALAGLARACELDPADLDTAALRGCELEVNVRHGGRKSSPPGHWINVIAARPIGPHAPEAPSADALDEVPF